MGRSPAPTGPKGYFQLFINSELKIIYFMVINDKFYL